MNSPRIIATRCENSKLERVVLDRPPVAVVAGVDWVMGNWWYRAGGYPPGEVFATWLDPLSPLSDD